MILHYLRIFPLIFKLIKRQKIHNHKFHEPNRIKSLVEVIGQFWSDFLEICIGIKKASRYFQPRIFAQMLIFRNYANTFSNVNIFPRRDIWMEVRGPKSLSINDNSSWNLLRSLRLVFLLCSSRKLFPFPAISAMYLAIEFSAF